MKAWISSFLEEGKQCSYNFVAACQSAGRKKLKLRQLLCCEQFFNLAQKLKSEKWTFVFHFLLFSFAIIKSDSDSRVVEEKQEEGRRGGRKMKKYLLLLLIWL